MSAASAIAEVISLQKIRCRPRWPCDSGFPDCIGSRSITCSYPLDRTFAVLFLRFAASVLCPIFVNGKGCVCGDEKPALWKLGAGLSIGKEGLIARFVGSL